MTEHLISAGWQAPTDAPIGEDILGWTGQEHVICHWVNNQHHVGFTTGWETIGGYDVGYAPVSIVAWMPLPTPPAGEQA